MKKIIPACFLFFLIVNYCKSQSLFYRLYTDVGIAAEDFQKTSDGGYIVTGARNDTLMSTRDIYLLKTDSSGNVQWMKTYSNSGLTFAHSVQQTTDGGYIVAGNNQSNLRALFIKTDANGNTLWTRKYKDGQNSYNAQVIKQINDHGYIAAALVFDGSFVSQCLMRMDSTGSVVWANLIDATYLRQVFQTDDGGFAAIGSNGSACIVKADSMGTVLWNKRYGWASSGIQYQDCEGSAKTADGGFILTGTYSLSSSIHGAYLLKTNAAGDTLWNKCYPGFQWPESLLLTDDGGYIVTGRNTNTYSPVFSFKTDSTGNVIWSRNYMGENKEYNVMKTASDGNLIMGGTEVDSAGVNWHAYLRKLDINGISACNDSAISATVFIPAVTLNQGSLFHSAVQLTNNTIIIVAAITLQDSMVCTGLVGIDNKILSPARIYPNPFRTSAVFDLGSDDKKYQFSLYNIFGEMLLQKENIMSGFQLHREHLATGIYFYRLTSEGTVLSGKIIVE